MRASYQVTLKDLVEFENNFNGTTFYHHFCVKTGVKRPEEILCYYGDYWLSIKQERGNTFVAVKEYKKLLLWSNFHFVTLNCTALHIICTPLISNELLQTKHQIKQPSTLPSHYAVSIHRSR